MRLGAALEAAVARATSADMARKIEATGRLMTEFFGDALLNAVFTETAFVHFMLWLMRLPASHGKAHGRNRYESVGRSLTKREEIDAADAADAGVRAEIEAMDLILAEKRALLTRRLVPRLSDAQIAKHHSRSKAIHEAARKVLGWAAGPWTSYLQEWRDEARRQQAQCQDPLALRRIRNKDRSAWSEERIGRLLSSTIFRGCFSSARRWRSGPLIVRDHTYWAPLIILHCAMRPEEALRLLKTNIAWRDGILCFVVDERADAGTKTASAVRVVPIPDILLRLGLLEWWHDRCREPGPLLFPEATRSETDGRASGTWGKRRRTLYRHLGIDDWREDGYAMRHTALTRLQLVGAPDNVREAIAGHEHGSVINRPYTETNLALLKRFLDRIDYGIEIDEDDDRGFPVIRRCSLLDRQAVTVFARLAGNGRLGRLAVSDPADAARPVIRLTRAFVEAGSDPAARDRLDCAARKLYCLLDGRRLHVVNEAAPDLQDEALEQAVATFVARGAVPARSEPAHRRRHAA